MIEDRSVRAYEEPIIRGQSDAMGLLRVLLQTISPLKTGLMSPNGAGADKFAAVRGVAGIVDLSYLECSMVFLATLVSQILLNRKGYSIPSSRGYYGEAGL